MVFQNEIGWLNKNKLVFNATVFYKHNMTIGWTLLKILTYIENNPEAVSLDSNQNAHSPNKWKYNKTR